MAKSSKKNTEDNNSENNNQQTDDENTSRAHPLEPNPDVDTNQQHPDPSVDFTNLLITYGVADNKARTIVKNMINTGSPDVFFNVPELMSKLTAFPMWIPPTTRKLVMDEWMAVNKINIPENYEDLMTSTRTTPQTVKRAEELKKKITEGAVWTIESDSDGNLKPHLIREGDEPGDTLVNIKEAIRVTAKDSVGDEMLVVLNEADGKYHANLKSPIVQKNLAAALAAAKQMNLDASQGKTSDPWDAWTDFFAQHQMMQQMMGGGQQGSGQITSVSEVIDAFTKLKALDGGGNQIPAYLSTPESFAAAVKAVVGGDNEKVTALMNEIKQLREDQHKTEVEQLRSTILALTNKSESDKNELLTKLADVEKNSKATGSGAFDLLRDAIGKLPDKLDVKDLIKHGMSNPPRIMPGNPGDTTKRLTDIAQKVEAVSSLKKAGDTWFAQG